MTAHNAKKLKNFTNIDGSLQIKDASSYSELQPHRLRHSIVFDWVCLSSLLSRNFANCGKKVVVISNFLVIRGELTFNGLFARLSPASEPRFMLDLP
jgi:hypothetical protein